MSYKRKQRERFVVMKKIKLCLVCAILAMCGSAATPLLDTSDDRVESPLVVNMIRIGTLKPRSTKEIEGSNWTLGCEGIGRGYHDFEADKDYIVPLGIKTIRVQACWKKCEETKGRFDFAWLDKVVLWAHEHGINVLLETDYGNPVYGEAGGGHTLGGAYPTGEEALAAWDRWVTALATHYKGIVRDWAMWNEPDIDFRRLRNGRKIRLDAASRYQPAQIVEQNIRTARLIKQVIPDARIGALSLAQNNPEFLERCLKLMGEDAKLFTWIIYHGYEWNPDASYANVTNQQAVLRKYAPHLTLRQGENGCNSCYVSSSALCGHSWSEYSQAKWNMRRMLGDLGHDIPSAVFSAGGHDKALVCTMRVPTDSPEWRYPNQQKALYLFRAYYAVQNVVSVFDNTLERVPEPALACGGDPAVAIYAYRKKRTNAPVFVFWDRGDLTRFNVTKNRQCPSDSFQTRPTAFTYTGRPLQDPVFVDLLTGRIYVVPEKNVFQVSEDVYVYRDIPVYDSPCLLTEKRTVIN